MTTPFIPGPWMAYQRKGIYPPVVVGGEYADEGEPDLIVDIVALGETEAQEQATVRLMAAAPELYEMLDKLCHAADSEMGALLDEAEGLLRRISE